MSETITIPAHIEGDVVRLDGPLPSDVERIEVVAHRKPASRSGQDLIAFLDSLPEGRRSKEDIDAQIEAERNAWA